MKYHQRKIEVFFLTNRKLVKENSTANRAKFTLHSSKKFHSIFVTKIPPLVFSNTEYMHM